MASWPKSAGQVGAILLKLISTTFFSPPVFLSILAHPQVHFSFLSLLVLSLSLRVTPLVLDGYPQKSSPCGFRLLILLNTPKLPEPSPSLSWKNPPTKRTGIPKFPNLIHRKDVLGFPGGAVVKNLPPNAGDTGSSPGPGRSHIPWSN